MKKLSFVLVLIFSNLLVEAQTIITDSLLPFMISKDASFNGNFNEYIRSNLSSLEKESNVDGTVIIAFTIDTTGLVTEARVLSGINPVLDNEVLKVINASPKWNPAIQMRKPVKSRKKIPIKFSSKK